MTKPNFLFWVASLKNKIIADGTCETLGDFLLKYPEIDNGIYRFWGTDEKDAKKQYQMTINQEYKAITGKTIWLKGRKYIN